MRLDKETVVANLRALAGYGVLLLVVYLANVQVQTYLGKRTLAASTLARVSLPEAFEAAARDNKLVLAELSAIWCAACRRLDKKVLADAAVQAAIERDYVFARIEYESDGGEAFMARYGVRGYPTVLVLDASGELVRRLPLTFDPRQFEQAL